MDAMKETVLIKATEMFLALGFKSVTMDDIAAELGISKKTIYQHFANKNDLVEATTNHLFETITNGIDAIYAKKNNPIDEFYIVRQFLANAMRDNKSPEFQLKKYFPGIFESLRLKQFEKLYNCMLNNLKRGIEQGLFRQDIDIEFTARIYFTGITGIKDTHVFPENIYTMEEKTAQYLEYHLRSIVTPKGLEKLTKTIAENIS